MDKQSHDTIYRNLERVAKALDARVVRDGSDNDPSYARYPWIDVSLDDDDEPLLRLNWGEWGAQDRIIVWPHYDRGQRRANTSIDRPRITMAQSKTPDQVAKGIRQRILADCREYWKACADYLDSEDRANARSAATLERLKPYGVEESKNGAGGVHHYNAPDGYPNGYVREIRIGYGGGTVDISLSSLPVATATRVMALIMSPETVDADTIED